MLPILRSYWSKGRSVPPTWDWGLQLALCVLGKPLTLSGLLIPGLKGSCHLLEHTVLRGRSVALPGPDASSRACPTLQLRDEELLGWWLGEGA